jgi:hypothetical protein
MKSKSMRVLSFVVLAAIVLATGFGAMGASGGF